jgi:hypothetical protein
MPIFDNFEIVIDVDLCLDFFWKHGSLLSCWHRKLNQIIRSPGR